MTRLHDDPRKLNLPALARQAAVWSDSTPLSKMERLVQETHGLSPAAVAEQAVQWKAMVEWRNLPGQQPGKEGDLWLHLSGDVTLPLVCQRCLQPVDTPLQVRQWYRFVATEDIAMAEDDDCEEDLLVLEPQFDLLAVLEDELLMALPLVPMHEVCPQLPMLQAVFNQQNTSNAASDAAPQQERPHPFAALASLRKSAG